MHTPSPYAPNGAAATHRFPQRGKRIAIECHFVKLHSIMNQPARRAPRGPAFRRAPEEKRSLLIEAGYRLFAAQGYDATSTAQIAREAGVSEGILFHHFGSKKGLFAALSGDLAQDAAEKIMPTANPHESEEQIVRAAFDYADAHPAMYEMLMNGSRELTEADVSAQSEVMVRSIEAQLRHAMAAGEVRRGNATIMAELQFALVDAAYKAWRRAGEPNQRDDYITEAATCMRAMLAASEPTTP